MKDYKRDAAAVRPNSEVCEIPYLNIAALYKEQDWVDLAAKASIEGHSVADRYESRHKLR